MDHVVWLSALFALVAVTATGCGEDRAPLPPAGSAEGEIRCIVTYAPWTSTATKRAAAQAIGQVTAYVHDASGSQILEQDLELVDSRAQGSLTVKAQQNLRVTLVFFEKETVSWIGEDTDVDVPAGGSTTANIEAHYMGTTITAPDTVATDEKIRLSWMARPFVQWYEVQESIEPDFASVSWVYSGPDTVCTVDAKGEYEALTTYYYRARAVTDYGAGPWHGQGSTGIAGDQGTIVIDIALPHTPPGRSITLTSLRDGSAVSGGEIVPITWHSAMVERVGIEYSSDGGETWIRLANAVRATARQFDWVAPVSGMATCLVRVFDMSDAAVADGSDTPFSVSADPEIHMVDIPAGRFLKGSYDFDMEELPRTVSVHAFTMSATEITQDQYEAVMGELPLGYTYQGSLLLRCGSCPVLASYFEAVEFCNRLSDLRGLERCYEDSHSVLISINAVPWTKTRNGYRLPTQTEWEYACRAGTSTRYYTGDSWEDLDRAAWYMDNCGLPWPAVAQPEPVGRKVPNAWALYDMHGNVYEWCTDLYVYPDIGDSPAAYDFTRKVIRGGAGASGAARCRASAARWLDGRNIVCDDDGMLPSGIGIRVVRGEFQSL